MTKIIGAGLSDTGRVRAENQDCFADFDPAEHSAHLGRLVIVADGVGGHRGGRVASRLAVESIAEAYYEDGADPTSGSSSSIEDRLIRAFHEANRRICTRSGQDPSVEGMASTCTALVVHDGRAFVAHLGDSRAYLVRDGLAIALTRDHSLVQSRIDAGLLTAEEARTHADRNIITRSLGFGPETDPALLQPPVELQAGDRLVLCTDGLHGVLTDDEIAQCVLRHEPAEACRDLVLSANELGGPDNITTVVLRVDEA